MDIHQERANSFKVYSIYKKLIDKIFNQGFIDDTSLAVNGSTTIEGLIQRLKQDAQSWSNLLYSSGGLLELSKCLNYLVFFKFDNTGHPSTYCPNHEQLQPIQEIIRYNQYHASMSRLHIKHYDVTALWTVPILNNTKLYRRFATNGKRYSVIISYQGEKQSWPIILIFFLKLHTRW
jgi:hypothetical protein